jgi:hypothetical protein
MHAPNRLQGFADAQVRGERRRRKAGRAVDLINRSQE